tara:strand:- start:8 stop:1000 length:993 start_codon:yes stop_codon:yes gene_type:complete
MKEKINVAIIIPCYKSKNKVKFVIKEILEVSDKLINKYIFKIYVVDDACPEESWKEIEPKNNIKILHRKKNGGCGAASIEGMITALRDENDIFIKIDSDRQHSPFYLEELIENIKDVPKSKLYFFKGSRYKLPQLNSGIPISRRLGSLIMEPIDRIVFGYKGLTDGVNGFIGMNRFSASFIFSERIKPRLKLNNLFQSSIIARCSNLDIQIVEFSISAIYGDEWESSFSSFSMIIPIISFWFSTLKRRIFYKYFLSLNFGTLWFLSFLFNFLFLIFLSFWKKTSLMFLYPNLILFSIFSLILFFIYDYSNRKEIKKVIFYRFLLEKNNLI